MKIKLTKPDENMDKKFVRAKSLFIILTKQECIIKDKFPTNANTAASSIFTLCGLGNASRNHL
tara:strand:- start:744 stop:932 length:189 start_codon:yes stop_codon:yes gene_type:complete